MSKETIVVLLLVVAAFFGGYYFSKNDGTKSVSETATPTVTQQAAAKTVSIDQVKALFDNSKNIIFGDKNSKLLLVEFSDPSCPYCSIASGLNAPLNKQAGAQFLLKADGGTYVAPEPELKKLVDSGKAAYVWLYANGHGNGELATQALYCAHESGKFWAVHDLLMNADGYELINGEVKNDKTKIGKLATYLKGAVDSKTLQSCIESGKYASRLSEDMVLANQMGFEGTPYFIVNTTRFAGAYGFTDMQAAVDEALK